MARNLSVDPGSAPINEKFKAIRISRLNHATFPQIHRRREQTHVAITRDLPDEEGFPSTRESAILKQEIGTRIFPADAITSTTELAMCDSLVAFERIARSNLSDAKKMQAVNSIVVRIIERIARLHGSTPPIFHLDIKLENFLISLDGSVMPADFTTSKTSEAEIENTGTLGYMDPYMARGEFAKTNNRAIDLFALGGLLNVIDHDVPQPKGLSEEEWQAFGGFRDKAAGIRVQGNTYEEAARLLTQMEPSERISIEDLLRLPCFTSHGPLMTNEELRNLLRKIP